MKVLLTGASGFVGSHVLDALVQRSIPVCLLLRSSSSPAHIRHHLNAVETVSGALNDSAALAGAVKGVTHVIHCAGATKAASEKEFFEVNERATRRLVHASNGNGVARFVYISSLAAAGPALPNRPAREDDIPAPVSIYGRSKLAGEQVVRAECKAEHVIIRPPAVYGPRDAEFLKLFKAVLRHVRPCSSQPLSLVWVKDLANAIVSCLEAPGAVRQTYHVASPEVATVSDMAMEIARAAGSRTIPLPVPGWAMWPVCAAHQVRTWVTGVPGVLSLQKYAELRAPGWVCDPGRLKRDLGVVCGTTLQSGVAATLAWYRQERWL